MMKIAILFALVAAAFAEPIPRLSPLSPTGRIVGGVATSIDEVPYQVSLQVFEIHLCGASIISSDWILTAAHCMNYHFTWYNTRTGSTLSNSGGTISSVRKVISHPSYAKNAWGIPTNDIALVRLDSILTLNSVQAVIGLYANGQESVVGASAVITGWGTLADGGSAPTVLQTVTIPIVSKADCNSAYSTSGGLPAGQICAAVPEGGKDACLSDSGGPLAIDGVLAGVASWGSECAARPGLPGAYTEVASYRSWITNHTLI